MAGIGTETSHQAILTRMRERLRVCYPPLPNPRRPAFALPPGAVDTHFHIFGPPDLFPFAAERAYTPQTAPLEHYLNLAAVLGIDRGVVTQPMGHGFDNAVTLDAVSRSAGRFRAVVKADDRFTEADYRAFHAGGARGVRVTVATAAAFDAARPMFDGIVARIADLGWSLTLHAMPEALLRGADWISGLPLPVVIDHFGRIDVAAGKRQEAFTVYRQLLGEPHVWAKICCPDRLSRSGYPYEDVLPFVAAAFESASPDRVIWGTDWPHTQRWELGEMCDDGDLVDLVPRMVPDTALQRRMLVDNPARLFDFGPR